MVSDTVLHELAQTVPTRQADKLQLLLNKLLERADTEASSANAASSSASNLGPEVPPATSAFDAVAILEATEAAGGALASDDIEALAAEPEPPPDPASLEGSAPPASFGPADDADPWAGWSASQLGQGEPQPASSAAERSAHSFGRQRWARLRRQGGGLAYPRG